MTIGQVSFHTRRCHPARVSGKAVADDAGLAMATATDPAQVERLRQIADQAMTLEMATERTHLESIERTRIGASEIARHRDGIDLPGARREQQRRLAGPDRLPRVVRIGAGGQQLRDDRRAAVARRERQRRHAVVVLPVDIGPGADERRRRLRVVAVRGPMERGRTVTLRRVDVRSGGQQRAHGHPVAALRGIGERGSVLGRRTSGGCLASGALADSLHGVSGSSRGEDGADEHGP